MMKLAAHLSSIILGRAQEAAASGNEVRLIFHGPPAEILHESFQHLTSPVVQIPGSLPILFQVAELPPGQTNPGVGQSGICNANHLLNLRNSHARASYIALVPPGQHNNMSVSTTTDEFGMRPTNSAGNVAFEAWWNDEFLQQLISDLLVKVAIPEAQRRDAEKLLESSLRDADEADEEKTARGGCWRVLARAFEASAREGQSAPTRLSLACGFPPMKNDTLSVKEQTATLAKIADHLADGWAVGLDRLKEDALEEDRAILSQFHVALREACERQTDFPAAPSSFYAPFRGLALGDPPAWWSALSVEKWLDLLTEPTAEEGDLEMVFHDVLLPGKGSMPILVAGPVTMSFTTKGEPTHVPVTVERTPKGKGGLVGQVTADRLEKLVDQDPPNHRAPLKYRASAPNFKPSTSKVVSLASWAPGIFVTSKHARKLGPPRARKGKGSPHYEATITFPGPGRYELQVYTSPGVALGDTAEGSVEGAIDRGEPPTAIKVNSPEPDRYTLELEVDSSYRLDLFFSPSGRPSTDTKTCRLSVSVDDFEQAGCRSEFERLIRANRQALDASEGRVQVRLDRNPRCSTLQEWILAEHLVDKSFHPIVFAEDYAKAWAEPSWTEPNGPLFSQGTFIHDPRPRIDELNAPEAFVRARKELAARIRGEDQSGLVESALLGRLASDDETFRDTLEAYLRSYQSWLVAEPEVASWVDVILVTSQEADGQTLSRTPDAVILSPLHPMRLAWQALAQQALLEAEDARKPCPSGSVLDPDCVPDVLTLGLRSAAGVEQLEFVAVENGTDYWSVLWNSRMLKGLPERSRKAPFGHEFGITVGGIAVGFSAAQVGRALEDVSDLVAAKSVMGVTITSSGGTTDASNQGLIDWCKKRYKEDDRKTALEATGHRVIEIYDERDASSWPDPATIANLAEDTGNKVRWFHRQPEASTPDLGIIAQLDMTDPSVAQVDARTPLGRAGLIRHRIRRQLGGAFLSESRQSLPPCTTGDALADRLAACISAVENRGTEKSGLSFAPNVTAIRTLLEQKRADYVAVSSSAIDPACFLGDWLQEAYLWDYELPSYSRRAGDTNGYYLLSRIKDADREALAIALARLPGCDDLDPGVVKDVLLEVARRGIPTIRGLAGDDSGTTGDLGMFIAARLLQDRFRVSGAVESILPVIEGSADDLALAIIVPVDPFRNYLRDLGIASGSASPRTRPDLLVVGARVTGTRVALHLTPIEVKCRPESPFPSQEMNEALGQAKALSQLLAELLPHEGQLSAWRLAFQHLLLSLVGFGMRVYSQHRDVVDRAHWSELHQRIAAAILDETCAVTIDDRGRLIIVDKSTFGDTKDADGDGFDETIVVNAQEAAIILKGDAGSFYQSVRAKIGNWALVPAARGETIAKRAPSLEPAPEAETWEAQHLATSDLGHHTVATGLDPADKEVTHTVSGGQRGAPQLPEEREVPTAAHLDNLPSGSMFQGVLLELGRSVDGFAPREISLNVSDTRLNHLNMGVVGDLGTGKTQLLKSLIAQITASDNANRGIRPRILIFDYKRDYSSLDFVQATGARVVRPERLPLNVFDTSTMEAATAPWLQRFRFFSDVLDKIYSGIGPVQRDKLKKAVRAAYDATEGGPPPTLYDVHTAYMELLNGKSDSIMAIIDDLVDMQVFAPSAKDTIPFDQFLDGVVVIALDALGQDDRSKNMLVAIMLNLFYENMLTTPKRPFLGTNPQLRAIDSYLLVDEADNIMRYEFDVLRKLLLQGREFGTGIILASQYLRHFKVNATDYREPLLTWFIHKVPNVTPAELSTLGLTGSLPDLAERVKTLHNHQCLYKSFDSPGEVIRGLPFFELPQVKK